MSDKGLDGQAPTIKVAAPGASSRRKETGLASDGYQQLTVREI
jgi:hypothetical protein